MTYYSYNGWTCTYCGAYVANGVVHLCGRPSTSVTPQFPSFQPWLCEHCYCTESALNKPEPHMACCKCGTVMAKRFVK